MGTPYSPCMLQYSQYSASLPLQHTGGGRPNIGNTATYRGREAEYWEYCNIQGEGGQVLGILQHTGGGRQSIGNTAIYRVREAEYWEYCNIQGEGGRVFP